MDTNTPDSLGEALRRLPGDVTALLKAELQFFKYELRRESAALVGASIGLAVALIFGAIALLAATATIIAALSLAMPVWLAALIVTVFYGIIAAAGLATALRRVKAQLAPPWREMRQEVRDDVALIKR